LVAAHHGGGVAVLHVAAPEQVHLHVHRRRLARHVHPVDLDLLHARATHHKPGLAAAIPTVEKLVDRLAARHGYERPVVAVDGLGPSGYGAPGGDLKQVGGEAGVGQRQVERRGTRRPARCTWGRQRRGAEC